MATLTNNVSYGIDKKTGKPVSAANDPRSGSAPVAPKVSGVSYGIDKKTGLPVGPENDPRGSAKVTPSGLPTDVATQATPAVPSTAPTNAQVPMAQQQGLPPGRTAQGITTDPLTGQQFKVGSSGVYERYQQGHSQLKQSGQTAPAARGEALGAISGAVPKADTTSVVDDYISQDPNVSTLMQGITKLLNPQQQSTTLLQDYKKLSKDSGLDQINQELIDADTVINGTEDDIRNEIQTAGGFGTDSQVQAMSLARNKGLLKRYNQLVQMKTDATNQLNTLSSLNSQDKQMAQQRLSTQISAMFNLANFQQQAQNNIKEQARWLTTTMGADGVYNAYKSDPRQLGFLEKTLGVVPGGLASMAAQAAQTRALDIAAKQATINSVNKVNMQFVSGTANQPAGTFDPSTGQFTPIKGTTGSSPQAIAQAQGNITSVDNILKSGGLGGAVGPNIFARSGGGGLDQLTGAKQNFLADVAQIQSQLTLQNLQNAKSNGATFGALSDGELNLLASSGSKLNSWAIKDGDKIVGYNANESDFKAELDKINNFQKLDYVLKGGDPSSVNVVEHPDGSLWTMNSNGTMTEIR